MELQKQQIWSRSDKQDLVIQEPVRENVEPCIALLELLGKFLHTTGAWEARAAT